MELREHTLEQMAQNLDISPTDYLLARDRYTAVKRWLEKGEYQTGTNPDIYLQGSFRLGTVVRPFRNDADAAFDIDQVCELRPRLESTNPRELKNDVGDHLNSNADYRRMLDTEGSRCWTIEYASSEDRPGFHIDVLPSLENSLPVGQIDITDKQGGIYSWSNSNPKGYYAWFKSKNPLGSEFVRDRKIAIFESNRTIFEGLEEVPTQLIRSPLQRAIQIMKRHRDVCFSGRDHRPISIIITTIAAHIYLQGSIADSIESFTNYVITRHHQFLGGYTVEPDGILDYQNGAWSIPNPVDVLNQVNPVENFADKWNKNAVLPFEFFSWVYQLARDLKGFNASGLSEDLSLRSKQFGEGESYPTRLLNSLNESLGSNRSDVVDQLLDLIHLGIDGKKPWRSVEAAALRNIDNSQGGYSKDVALINYYQTIRHQGKQLSESAVQSIRRILNQHNDDADFVVCCNLLLGNANHFMIQDSIKSHDVSRAVMSWPIMRLVDQELFLPPNRRVTPAFS